MYVNINVSYAKGWVKLFPFNRGKFAVIT